MAAQGTKQFRLLSRWDRYRMTTYLLLLLGAAISPLATLRYDEIGLIALVFVVALLASITPLKMKRQIERHHRKLAARIAESSRAEITLPRHVPNALLRLALSVLFWPLAGIAVAEAARAATAMGGVLLFLLSVILAVVTAYVLFDPKAPRSLVIGEDGLRIGDGEFLPFAAIERLRVEVDALLIVRRGGEDMRITLDVETAEFLRRQVELRAANPRVSAATDGRAKKDAQFRVADAPHAALVSILRDGSQSLPERVRVAEVLSVSAPDELERFVLETADPELEKRIAPLTKQANER